MFASGDAGWWVTHIDEGRCPIPSTFGPIDFYFANAGIGGGQGLQATERQWDAAFNVNVMAHAGGRRSPRSDGSNGVNSCRQHRVSGSYSLQLRSSATRDRKRGGPDSQMAQVPRNRSVNLSCLCPMGVDTNLAHCGTGPRSEIDRGTDAAGGDLRRAVLTTYDGVATAILDAGIADERFLILPRPEVLDMYRHRDRLRPLVAGMQR